MSLKNFIPGLYRDNQELNAIIDAVQPELDLITIEMRNKFDDTFAATATLGGVLKWEILLGITADPSTEGLQFRRDRILNRLASNIPFTERMLQQIMDNIIGEGGWSYSLDYNNYTLDIVSLRPGRNWVREMQTTLEKIIPANIVWTINIYIRTWQSIYEDFPTWGDLVGTWQEVTEGA